jgi:hypothetical protein
MISFPNLRFFGSFEENAVSRGSILKNRREVTPDDSF